MPLALRTQRWKLSSTSLTPPSQSRLARLPFGLERVPGFNLGREEIGYRLSDMAKDDLSLDGRLGLEPYHAASSQYGKVADEEDKKEKDIKLDVEEVELEPGLVSSHSHSHSLSHPHSQPEDEDDTSPKNPFFIPNQIGRAHV